jgi:phosphoribosylformylglycinamidine synthase PurS subunit
VNNWTARIRVTLKPAVNDPQGLAIRGGLHQLGFADVANVRAGKFFEVNLHAADREAAEKLVGDMCRRLLANPVIEDYSFELSSAPEGE